MSRMTNTQQTVSAEKSLAGIVCCVKDEVRAVARVESAAVVICTGKSKAVASVNTQPLWPLFVHG